MDDFLFIKKMAKKIFCHYRGRRTSRGSPVPPWATQNFVVFSNTFFIESNLLREKLKQDSLGKFRAHWPPLGIRTVFFSVLGTPASSAASSPEEIDEDGGFWDRCCRRRLRRRERRFRRRHRPSYYAEDATKTFEMRTLTIKDEDEKLSTKALAPPAVVWCDKRHMKQLKNRGSEKPFLH